VLSCLLSIISVAGAPISSAEDSKPIPKVALLSPAPPVEHYRILIRDVLRGLGYEPGRNLIYIERWAGGSEEQLHRDAAELVGLKVDVIQAGSSAAVRAAVRATRTIPIVAVDMESDPVANGWAAGLAHPGANLTGFFLDLPALSGKRLEQLKEIVPGVEKVAVLWDASLDRTPLKATEASARDLGLRMITLEVRRGQDIEQAFRRAVKEHVQAVLIWGSPMLDGETSTVAAIAVRHRLPIAGFFPFHAESGFLMSYGPDVDDLVRRSFVYIDRVVKGEKPSALPIQGPEKFELVVNLRTAAAVGIKFPQHLLLQADRVIK
jgi:putative ABC transport system substrate-binding protein